MEKGKERKKHEKTKVFKGAEYPLVFGHRGCSSLAPENTLAAFSKALDLGVPGVELDVQLCASGEVMVYHDYGLQRLTGQDQLLTESDYATLSRLDAGGWFDKAFRGEKIPRLEEVFQLARDKLYYDVELKIKGYDVEPLARRVVDIICSFNLEKRCLLSSFNPFALIAVRKIHRELKTAIIYSLDQDVPWLLRRGAGRFISRCSVLKPHKDQVAAALEKSNYPVITWTVDDPREARRLRGMGVTGVISNSPQDLLNGNL